MATIETLIDYKTFSINQSKFSTIDKVLINGKQYSSKPPMISMYGAGIYWIQKHYFGRTIDEAYAPITKAIGPASHILLLIIFFLAIHKYIQDVAARIFAYIGMAAGYFGILYSQIINNHTVAAACMFLILYLAMRIRTSEKPHWTLWIAAGLFTGFLPTFDIPSTSFSIAITVYLLFVDFRKTLFLFLPAAAIPVCIHFYAMYSFSGSILPVQVRSLKGYFVNDSTGEPPSKYFYNMMIGNHGIFAYSPLLAFGIFELILQLFTRGKFWRESLVVLFTICLVTTYYTFRTNNYGGVAVAFRWLIPSMPCVIFFAGVFLDRLSKTRVFPIMCFVFLFLVAVNMKHLQRERRPLSIAHWEKQYNNQGLWAYPCFLIAKCPKESD